MKNKNPNQIKEIEQKSQYKSQQRLGLDIIDNLFQFYKPCPKQNFQMGDEGQSFKDFLDMKGVQPNEQGTGRISFSSIKQIELLIIKRQTQKKKQDNRRYLGQVKQLLQVYLARPANIAKYELEVDGNKINDKNKNLQYCMKLNKGRMNSLQILDLLLQYKEYSKLLIAFIQHELHENGEDIYGRACGNGVAIIDLTLIKGKKAQAYKFYETCIHQTLHTLGFDHCLKYSCLMNPCVSGEIWLCPQCLNKIFSQLQGINVLQWAQKIVRFIQKELKSQKYLLVKSKKILDHLSQTNTKL